MVSGRIGNTPAVSSSQIVISVRCLHSPVFIHHDPAAGAPLKAAADTCILQFCDHLLRRNSTPPPGRTRGTCILQFCFHSSRPLTLQIAAIILTCGQHPSHYPQVPIPLHHLTPLVLLVRIRRIARLTRSRATVENALGNRVAIQLTGGFRSDQLLR